MAVAVSADTIGATDAKVTVRAPYVIVPNLPAMASPGDEFDVSVTVTNTVAASGDTATVSLKASADAGLSLVGDTSFTLAVPEGGDKTVVFKVKALDACGNAELRFAASGSGESSAASASLSVRPAVPYRTTVTSGTTRASTAKILV